MNVLCGLCLSSKGRKEKSSYGGHVLNKTSSWISTCYDTGFTITENYGTAPDSEVKMSTHQLWIYIWLYLVSKELPNPVVGFPSQCRAEPFFMGSLKAPHHFQCYQRWCFYAGCYSSIKTKALTGRHGSNIKACCVSVPSFWIVYAHVSA